jgi:acetolactate synthase-1/2/3 large subunit
MARVAQFGVRHVFVIPGGGAMHLNDALRKNESLSQVFNLHEQACAIAAEGYARVTRRLGVALVTSGPGGSNCATGVLEMWQDSIPGLFLSGQVRFDTTVASTGLPLRQLGDQEADIVRMVAPITKYAASVRDPALIRYHLEKALHLAVSGRPGPVWLDIPLNVQSALVDPEALEPFDPGEFDGIADEMVVPSRGRPVSVVRSIERRHDVVEPTNVWPAPSAPPQNRGALLGSFDQDEAESATRLAMNWLQAAKRPVVLAGSAIQGAGSAPEFLRFVEAMGIPVATAWNGLDAIPTDHPLFVGRPGTVGDRAGNFAVQNADVLLVLGCRLNIRQIGYEFAAFAREAKLVMVEIDAAELAKPTISPDLAIQADVRWFLRTARDVLEETTPSGDHHEWLRWCRERLDRYPVVAPRYRDTSSPVNPYVFVDELSRQLGPNDVIVMANGAACVVALQVLRIQDGQRIVVNSGTAGMGFDLPAAIGSAFALRAMDSRGRVICLAGDGSIQMNLQELQTVQTYGLPIKVFVFNNAGYLSMRLTQDNLFAGNRFGEGPATGLNLPDMVAICGAYGLRACRVDDLDEVPAAISRTLDGDDPAMLDVIMDPDQGFVPKVIAERREDGTLVSKPLEDMYPWLDRAEFADSMLVSRYGKERTEHQ